MVVKFLLFLVLFLLLFTVLFFIFRHLIKYSRLIMDNVLTNDVNDIKVIKTKLQNEINFEKKQIEEKEKTIQEAEKLK